ncbi:MAG: FG-GAP repeat domain-containing protein, partial [Planctomycetota bacterium]
MRFPPIGWLAAAFLAPAAQAQFNEPWIEFELSPGSLNVGQAISDNDNETDLAWGDLDQDGDTDLVVVRKEPFTTAGQRTNLLLMNEAGVLTDRTALFASASDVPGDMGFLTPTNDRDVVVVDLTGDGFPEVVTACDVTPGQPKHITHPRVYLNLGVDNGVWQGLRYEDGRFPQLLHFVSGIPLEPWFAAVDAGDLDGDGDIDLYFGDNDTGLTLFGPTQPFAEDTEDRLMLNDGTGVFTDASLASAGPPLLQSGFSNAVEIGDFNGDGFNDIAKQTSYASPSRVQIAYNDPLNPGQFFNVQSLTPPSPYFIESGDMNADGRLDIAIVQNANDGVAYNQSTLPDGTVDWALPLAEHDFLVGGEGPSSFSFASNTLSVDLNGDGWNELITCDIDAEFQVYEDGRYTHIYHNRGETPGQTDVVLREERAASLGDYWIGARGLTEADLRWAHDVASFDVNGDTLPDLILSRREGTQVWLQTGGPICQVDEGLGQGAPVLEVCGAELASGEIADLRLFAGIPGALTLLALGDSYLPIELPEFGVTVGPFPVNEIIVLSLDGNGELGLAVPGGGGPGQVTAQAFVLNALDLTWR